MKRFSKLIFAVLFMLLAFAVAGCRNKEPEVKDPTIAFAESNLEVTVGDEFTLRPTITNLENATVDFTFSAEGIVSYANNKFTAESAGTVLITATLQGYSDIKASITVKVNAPAPVLVTSVAIAGEATMDEGEAQTLVATVLPENASNKAVEWSSSDATVASVGTNGMVNALKAGTAIITAKAKDGSLKEATITITVNATTVPVTQIDFSVVEKMYEGNTQALFASVLPREATVKTVTWSSSNEEIATVDNTGLVTAIAKGKVTITATANDGSGVKCQKTITVEEFIKPDYTACNPEWEFEELGAEVELAGKKFEVGYSAYAHLDEAINAANKGTYVASGEYVDDANITAEDFELIGPNSKVDPNKVTRSDEAIITGTITIKNGSKNISIKGFAFTLTGMINCEDNVVGVEVAYNNVYDTNDDVAAWTEARQQAEAVFAFWNPNNNTSTGNIVITNNKFSNISETCILLARLKNVTVKDNGFYNFKLDAIRAEGGYNYGEWLFENNKFINDELQANNGMYLQSVSGIDEEKYQVIKILNNTFKNIGNSELGSKYTGAISARTYQEKGLKTEMLYNTFENCVNYINYRNNGANADTYISNINYNKFVGVPSGVYHRNAIGANDTSTSNPPLTVMDYNLFLNADGTVADFSAIQDKFLDLSSESNKNNFASKAEYEEVIRALGVSYDIVVNAEWATLEANAEVEFENLTYKMGETAFASITEAVEAAAEGNKIFVVAGQYADEVTVNKNNITLLGPNYNIFAGNTNRNPEAVLNQKITVATGVSGFTLNGFEIATAGQLWLENATSGIKFIYNVINAATADGTVHTPIEADSLVSNLTASYNYSDNQKGNRFIWAMNIDGITAINNEITSPTAVAYDFINASGYIKGKVDIIGNTYKNSNQSFIYSKGVGQINATIEGNYVSGIKDTIIDFRKMVEDGDNVFNIRYNTFVEAGCGWCPIRIRTEDYDANDTVVVNVENNKFIDSYYNDSTGYQFIENPSYASQADPFKKIYVVGKNYYSIEGNAFTTLADVNFCDAAISFDTAYATEDACPAYVKEDEIKPETITITNKIEQMEAFTSHLLTFTMTPDNATNKKVGFTSTNTKAATVTSAGLINALSGGTTEIIVYAMADNEVLDKFTLTVNPVSRIELRFEGNTVLSVGETLQLEATYYGESSDAIAYESSDTDIATVDATGKITAVANGSAVIKAKVGTKEAEVGITVANVSELSEILQSFVSYNNGVVMDETFKYIGSDDGSADYEHEVYGSVSDYYAGVLPTVEKNMLDTVANPKIGVEGGPTTMHKLEWIVVHDTAGSGSTSTARANSGWCTNPSNTGSSWHYTIGNDGIFQQLEDNVIAWHAGDGTGWSNASDNYSTKWYDTGIAYEGDRPTVTCGADGYFYVNGKKSLVEYPTKEGVTPHINTVGLVCVKGENGNYKIPTTWISSSYGNAICARGGNLNGIGIETAVNMGSDVYLTWQRTAKFVANLLVKYDLTPDRVFFHNNFANKPCPNTMITAGLVDTFLSLVYAEYEIAKTYSDYTITFVSNNPEIIDNTGRVVKVPTYTTNVSYTVTVTKGGNSESITLNSLVIGKLN